MVSGGNPFLHRLGFAPGERVVIVHADDVGLCPATVAAFRELALAGAVSSGSLMVPCPAFAEAAAFCRDNPEVDAGVHLTLTCERESRRWGPVSAAGVTGSLLDEEGFFPRRREPVGERADPDAAAEEMRAQLDCALTAGVAVTHLDTHMFAALQPRLLPAYLGLARERRLPALLWRPRPDRSWLEEGEATLSHVAAWEEAGFPVMDHVDFLPLGRLEDRWEQARAVFDALPPGLTCFIVHPACDDPELRETAPDWRARVADWELLRSGRPAEYLRAHGIQVTGYRELRDAL